MDLILLCYGYCNIVVFCYGYCSTCTFCHRNRCFVGYYFSLRWMFVRLPFLFLDLMHSCMLNNLNLLFKIFMIISCIRLGLLLSACY